MRRLSLLCLLAGCGPAVIETKPAGDSGAPCDAAAFFPDGDGDGFGAAQGPVEACEAPAGFVTEAGDCDDTDAAVHPGAVEVCDGIDGDCDGAGDEAWITWYADADADGFGDPATGSPGCAAEDGRVADGTDCDDADPTVHPAAQEVCGDLDDDDCDGIADVGAPRTWHPDDDGDGYGHMTTSETSCEPPDGWVLDGSDCRPDDAAAHPGAAEACDGDDDDCDGEVDEDFEADGDGHVSEACGGDDCDDADAGVHPDAEELCDDAVDNDCDGTASRCGYDGTFDLGAADAKVYSASANFDAGRLVDVGDVNADGYDDLVVGTMYADGYGGGAYVLYGPIAAGTSTLDAAGHRIRGERSTYMAGRSLGVGDVNGDGFEDIGLGAPDGTDKEWIVFGPVTGDVDLADDFDVLYEGVPYSETGHGSDLADVDGDGVADAVIGAYEDSTGGRLAGSVFIHYGPVSAGTYDVRDAGAQLIGDAPSAYAGRYLRAGADLNGDGIGDILAASPYSSVAGSYAGAAYVVYGGVVGDFDLGSADGFLIGENAGDYASEELAMGDVDGDGLADVVLGSYSSSGGYYAGAAYVVYGPASGTRDLSAADVILRGNTPRQQVGLGLAVADVDDDGVGELLVGAAGDGTSARGAGAAYLFYGPPAASLTLADAQAVFLGEGANDSAGEGVALGDLDADGLGDVIIGACAEGTGGTGAGAVYVKYPDE